MIVQSYPQTNQWFLDPYTEETGLAVKIRDVLFHKKTRYQDIKIATTLDLGRVLFLNDLIYRTEVGGFSVPEMLAHIPMRTGRIKRNILLIGGGDGYTQTEILKYESVQHLDMVDIDETVAESCRTYFDHVRLSFDDPRLHIHTMDGHQFLSQTNTIYDLILVTPTEAYDMNGQPGISFSLFQDDFYELVAEHLSADGLFVTDGGAIFYDFGALNYATLTPRLRQLFAVVKPCVAIAKSIPGHLFSIVVASMQYDPESEFRLETANDMKTEYYNSEIHRASFSLPRLMLNKMKQHNSSG